MSEQAMEDEAERRKDAADGAYLNERDQDWLSNKRADADEAARDREW